MITIQIFGLDHFVVGQYSREHTSNLADLFETEEKNVSFLSSDSVYLHAGVEQSSWNCLVIVRAPHRYEVLEKGVADYLLKTLSTFAIHVIVEFDYYHDHAHYELIHPTYPRFITADQIRDVTADVGDEDDGEIDNPIDLDENPSEDELYTGNAFEGFEEKLAKAKGGE